MLKRRFLHAPRIALGLGLLLVVLGGIARAGGGGGDDGGVGDLSDAPEIDPGSAMSALTLLTGGILLIGDRVRKRGSSE